MNKNTYNVTVKCDRVCHLVDVVGASDCDAIANLDGALLVHVVARLVEI